MGDRLPAPPRERKPALAALAVLLILVGALGATTLVMRAGDRVEAVLVTERVPAGQPIPESAITSVLVAEDSTVSYVKWAQRGQLGDGGLRAGVELVPGTVLVGRMLTDREPLANDEVLVGVAVGEGRYPTGLKPGNTVTAHWVGDVEDPSASTVLVDDVAVHSVYGSSNGADDLTVTLVVRESDAGALTRAAAAGSVSLVVVPQTED